MPTSEQVAQTVWEAMGGAGPAPPPPPPIPSLDGGKSAPSSALPASWTPEAAAAQAAWEAQGGTGPVPVSVSTPDLVPLTPKPPTPPIEQKPLTPTHGDIVAVPPSGEETSIPKEKWQGSWYKGVGGKWYPTAMSETPVTPMQPQPRDVATPAGLEGAIIDYAKEHNIDVEQAKGDLITYLTNPETFSNVWQERGEPLRQLSVKFGLKGEDYYSRVPVLATSEAGETSIVFISSDKLTEIAKMTPEQQFEALQGLGVYPSDWTWVTQGEKSGIWTAEQIAQYETESKELQEAQKEHDRWIDENIKSDDYLSGILTSKGEDAAVTAWEQRQTDMKAIYERSVLPKMPQEYQDAYHQGDTVLMNALAKKYQTEFEEQLSKAPEALRNAYETGGIVAYRAAAEQAQATIVRLREGGFEVPYAPSMAAEYPEGGAPFGSYEELPSTGSPSYNLVGALRSGFNVAELEVIFGRDVVAQAQKAVEALGALESYKTPDGYNIVQYLQHHPDDIATLAAVGFTPEVIAKANTYATFDVEPRTVASLEAEFERTKVVQVADSELLGVARTSSVVGLIPIITELGYVDARGNPRSWDTLAPDEKAAVAANWKGPYEHGAKVLASWVFAPAGKGLLTPEGWSSVTPAEWVLGALQVGSYALLGVGLLGRAVMLPTTIKLVGAISSKVLVPSFAGTMTYITVKDWSEMSTSGKAVMGLMTAMSYLPFVALAPRAVQTIMSRVNPKVLTYDTLAFQSDVARIPATEALRDVRLRAMTEAVEMVNGGYAEPPRIVGTGPDVLTLARVGHDVVIKDIEGNIVGHVSPMQRFVPDVLYHTTNNIESLELGAKQGRFVVGETGVEPGMLRHGDLMYFSQQPAAQFGEKGILAVRTTSMDVRAFPDWILDIRDLTERRNAVYQWVAEGNAKPGMYPLFKSYGVPSTLEYEWVLVPDTELKPLTPTRWTTGTDVAIQHTRHPITGREVPIYWFGTDSAVQLGLDVPGLVSKYKAEAFAAFVQPLRELAHLRPRRVVIGGEEGALSPFTSNFGAVEVRMVEAKIREFGRVPTNVPGEAFRMLEREKAGARLINAFSESNPPTIRSLRLSDAETVSPQAEIIIREWAATNKSARFYGSLVDFVRVPDSVVPHDLDIAVRNAVKAGTDLAKRLEASGVEVRTRAPINVAARGVTIEVRTATGWETLADIRELSDHLKQYHYGLKAQTPEVIDGLRVDPLGEQIIRRGSAIMQSGVIEELPKVSRFKDIERFRADVKYLIDNSGATSSAKAAMRQDLETFLSGYDEGIRVGVARRPTAREVIDSFTGEEVGRVRVKAREAAEVRAAKGEPFDEAYAEEFGKALEEPLVWHINRFQVSPPTAIEDLMSAAPIDLIGSVEGAMRMPLPEELKIVEPVMGVTEKAVSVEEMGRPEKAGVFSEVVVSKEVRPTEEMAEEARASEEEVRATEEERPVAEEEGRVVSEERPPTEEEGRVLPEERPSTEETSRLPEEYRPPYEPYPPPPEEYRPPYEYEPSPPPPEAPPVYPVPLRGPIEFGDGHAKRRQEIPQGSVTWRQGFVWKYIPPEDFDKGLKPRSLKNPPAGAVVTGRTPKETIQVIGGGEVPQDISVDLGITDIFITGGTKNMEFTGRGMGTDVGTRIPHDPGKGMTIQSGPQRTWGSTLQDWIEYTPKTAAQKEFMDRHVAEQMAKMDSEDVAVALLVVEPERVEELLSHLPDIEAQELRQLIDLKRVQLLSATEASVRTRGAEMSGVEETVAPNQVRRPGAGVARVTAAARGKAKNLRVANATGLRRRAVPQIRRSENSIW